MPPLPGEVPLCTLFADVHYYFGSPTSSPPHHRFDKGSYLYLYHDAMNRRGRVEVANAAGTPAQDAFAGYLDLSHIAYTHKQPNLFTITADAPGHASSPQSPDLSQWHLPAYDPHNQTKYLYKIHTVDIYLWTADDASLLLDSLRRVTASGQIRVADAPPELGSSVSPVVQQLEKAAISSPNPYGRSDSISTTHTSHSQPRAYSNATPVSPPSSPPNDPHDQQSYTPIAAYNPAAAAAPEPRVHREKTPPPPDAENGNGLTSAANYNNPHQQTPVGAPSFGPGAPASFGPTAAGGMFFSGPPTAAAPTPGLQRQATQPTYTPSFAGPPSQPVHDPSAQQQQTHPGLSRQSTQASSFAAPPTQAADAPLPTQSPPSGQYAQHGDYSYHASSSQQHSDTNIKHGIHGMLYRPEDGSAAPAVASTEPGKSGKFEKKMNSLLKRLDKGF